MQAAASLTTIEAVDPQHPHALALLGEAAVEARALYPELFAPDAPAPGNPPLGARDLYLLAWRDGRAVGCGALRERDALTGEVRRMFVTRPARRDGVARALLARLEADAQSLGYRRLVLETGTRQQAAVTLYGQLRLAPHRTVRALHRRSDEPVLRQVPGFAALTGGHAARMALMPDLEPPSLRDLLLRLKGRISRRSWWLWGVAMPLGVALYFTSCCAWQGSLRAAPTSR
jgi:GNAT superfamily N-acetyltransferase